MNLEDEQTNEHDFYCNISCTVFVFCRGSYTFTTTNQLL